MSKTRKKYIGKLIGRCLVFVFCCLLCAFAPQHFDVLEGFRFFKAFSPLHILWLIWMANILLQMLPIRHALPLGAQKLFANRYEPARAQIDREALRAYTKASAKAAGKVLLIWCALILSIGVLYWTGLIGKIALFLISVNFYICDLICVLIWCPFRLMMKTRCCSVCRIFNWDHFMMFSPLIFMGGFYALSLVVMSVIVMLIWELHILIHPERFWDQTNATLKCSHCTDKLCTQYCPKRKQRDYTHLP